MNFHSAKKKNAGVAGYVKFSDVADGNSGKLCGTIICSMMYSGPVSRAAGMDCECPLYRHVANKQKVRGTIL